MLVVFANTVGAPRPLQDVLRERHEDRLLAHASRKAYRAKTGAPEVDDYDVEEERTRLSAMLASLDADGAPDLALLMLGHEAGAVQIARAREESTPPGPWEPVAGLDGILIEPIFPAASKTKALRRAMGDAVNAGSQEASDAAEDAILRAGIKSLSGLPVAGADMPMTVVGLDDDTLEAFRACGLHVWLLVATLHLWGIERGKAWRSGVAQQAT